MTAVPRTLPLRLLPMPGEALDSWLEALARRMNTPLGGVLSHFGFPTRGRSGNHLRDIPPDWTIALRDHETAAIAHATGLTPAMITAMTLAFYNQRALSIDVDRRHVNRRVLWGRGRGSRFCPDCLTTSGGRWQMAWRLGWAFACPLHHRLLADNCPNCDQVQRERPRSGKAVPPPSICGNLRAHPDGPPTGGCGFDLTQTRTLLLPAGHPALRAQQRLLEIIESGTAAFGVYSTTPQPALSALADIRAVGGRILADLPADALTDVAPPELTSLHLSPDPTSRLASRAADRPGFMAPPRAVSTAVAVTVALRVLEQPDLHQAGALLRDLLEAMREDLWQISTTSIDSWGRGLSPTLNAVHLAALAPSLRPSEQLRHRTATATPSRPHLTETQVTKRARKIPSTFWPSWTVRLTPAKGVYPRVLAPVLASTLLITSSKTTLDDAARHLGAITEGIDISRVLQLLHDHPNWPDITTALTRLADHIDAHDIPINYQRRRRLDYTGLLPHEQWIEICRRTGTPPGHWRREQIIRCRLFHRISGLPPEAAPGYAAARQAEFRAEAARAAALRTPELVRELDQAAREFLARHRIRHEPVTWQPPTTLLDGLNLPGPEPARIDIPHLHQLIRQQGTTVNQAAEAFGTSIEAIRLVLDEHPAPAPPPTEAVARATGGIRHQARQKLPKKTFARLYLDQHKSLNQIATLTGISRQTLTRLAHEYDIPLRAGPQDYRRRGTIERDWLIEQYVRCRRTLPDLAREKGMSTANMARWAHIHNIPLRGRGGASHDAALRVPDKTAEMMPMPEGEGFERKLGQVPEEACVVQDSGTFREHCDLHLPSHRI
ncbi:TniQ family protein [Streptomyces sp900116325]|uniref:TniQ family protein n=1 Tax=Streptomyces sp. 900116325 TaxID=3154295 RepID=UPI0034020C47